MVQKLAGINTENELIELQDNLYATTIENLKNGERPSFKGLIEAMKSKATILTAIHNIKKNKGSETPGTDGEKMQTILEKDYFQVIHEVQNAFSNYKSKPIRRKYIPKDGKKEKRPLGIPTNFDKIIQECIKIVIEPILEAQFYKYSFGFRPMRDTKFAKQRVESLLFSTGYSWVVEGDIKSFFNNVDHRILLKQLYSMGIHDRRVLAIIKEMLRAGIMNECKVNELGTQQGGIISPLLSNVYLHKLDMWIAREWELKKTKYEYADHRKTLRALKTTNLKPAHFVRYADDWVLITDSRENAEKWKHRIAKYLQSNLKIELSMEKTKVTNVKKKAMKFVGFEMRVRTGNGRKGVINMSKPITERLPNKVKNIRESIQRIGKTPDKNDVIYHINKINSQIRGLLNYYESATHSAVIFSRLAYRLEWHAMSKLKGHGGKWVPANQVGNLLSIHEDRKQKIPAIEHHGKWIGITSLAFVNWKNDAPKKPKETPYSPKGRLLYVQRTQRKSPKVRADELLLSENMNFNTRVKSYRNKFYNFEYFLNRAYAFNRDKGKCKICSRFLAASNLHTHHINPKLPIEKINKVPNLASLCVECHNVVHKAKDLSRFTKTQINKINKYRGLLNN